MTTNHYTLTNQFKLHGDLPRDARFVGDGHHDTYDTPNDIAALVASGDLFITLATELEFAADQLDAGSASVVAQLEHLTANLLYLQQHYKVTPTKPNHRQ